MSYVDEEMDVNDHEYRKALQSIKHVSEQMIAATNKSDVLSIIELFECFVKCLKEKINEI